MAEKKFTPQKRSPHGPGPVMATEKAKDFGGTMKTLFKYMKRHVPAMIVAIIIAVASVVLSVNIPNVLGGATDEVISGVTQKTIYESIKQVEEKTGMEFDTVKDMLDFFESQGTDISEFTDKIPEAYADDVMNMSLKEQPGVDMQAVMKIVTTLVILIVISSALNYLQGFIMTGVAQKAGYRMRKDIQEKINKLPLSYYDKTSHGDVLSYLTNDVDTVAQTLNQSLSSMVTAIVTLIGVLIIMISINGWLTIVAVAIVPVSMLIIMGIVKKSQKHFNAQQENLADVNGHIEEMYGAHNVVTLYNGQEKSIEEFNEMNDKLYASAWKSQFLSGSMMPVMQAVGNVGYVLICVLGGYLVINGNLSVGNIQSFMQYIRQFTQPIQQIANLTNQLQMTAAAAERVFGFLAEEEEEETGDGKLENAVGEIDFEHVKFGYNPNHIIINDFSSQVKQGERIAIVGPTGAGKSTIIKLLMRFYGLNGGAIYIDGKDITSFKRSEVRDNFGMVLQETWLFGGSIMENIRYGRLDATDEEVVEAAKMACADRFIRTLPGGYNFEIDEEGSNISQGQKQLLTIARAIISEPKMLILDEATSSVDTRTELLIQKAMNRLMEGKTSFIIAHRLSTIKDADKILVLKDGDVIEQGSHDELIAQHGFYYDLYMSQFENKQN